MNKNLIYAGGGLVLGILLFSMYKKYNKSQKKKDCNKQLELALATLRPTADFDMDAYKKDFMDKCLKGQ